MDGARAICHRRRHHRWPRGRRGRYRRLRSHNGRDRRRLRQLHAVRARRDGHRGGLRGNPRLHGRCGSRLGVVAGQLAEAPRVVKGLLVAIVLALVVLGSGPGRVNADTTPTDPQQAQLALIAQIRAQLGSNLADALAAQDQLRKSLQDNAVQQQELQAKIVEVEQKIAELDVKIADAQRREMILLSRQSTALAQQVTDMLQQQQDAIIAAAMQAVWTQLQLWLQSNNVGQIATSAGHSTKYRFIWPEPQAQVSQPFGPSTFWFEPAYGRYAHFHTGIDLVEPFGSPVYAADDGIVALVGSSSSGYGNYVVIAHSGGFDTLYGHLSTTLVKSGQRVTQGTAVGLEGSTGNSTGPHVHFELRVAQKPVDPTPYLPPGAPSAYRG